jgi:RHS repeat-associated protein
MGNVIAQFQGATIEQSLAYDPWGAATVQHFGSDTATPPLRWKGLLYEDGITSLYYMRSRWYDAITRRFVSPDPLGMAAGVNQYAYAGGNPIEGSDPSGLCKGQELTGDDMIDGNAVEYHSCSANGVILYFEDALGFPYTPYLPQVGQLPLVQVTAQAPPPLSIVLQLPGIDLPPMPVGQYGGSSGLNTVVSKGGNGHGFAYQPTLSFPTRFFGTHWCGPGGAGWVVNPLDRACQQHDACYDRNGFTTGSNYLNPSHVDVVALQACNQALCDAASTVARNNYGSGEVSWYFRSVPFGACD